MPESVRGGGWPGPLKAPDTINKTATSIKGHNLWAPKPAVIAPVGRQGRRGRSGTTVVGVTRPQLFKDL